MRLALARSFPKRSLKGDRGKEATDAKAPMKRDVDGNAIDEALSNLETRLESYLVEWRRALGIQEWLEAGIDRKEQQRPAATEREEKRR